MANVVQIIIQAATTYSASTTYYWSATNAARDGSSEVTEANTQITYRTGGVLSKLFIHITVNSVSATSTFRTRVNGANGSQTASITASTTGEFEDSSNTDTITANDEVNYQLVCGASGTTLTALSASTVFAASSDTTSHYSANSSAGVTYSTASTTNYSQLTGSLVASTETNQQLKIPLAGTLKNLFAYVSSNARTTTTTIRSRLNTANGAMSVSIGSTATGIFEDTSNTDTIAVDDLLCSSITTGTGTGNLVLQHITFEFVSTSNQFFMAVGCGASGVVLPSSTSRWFPIGGSNSSDFATAAACETKARLTATVSKLGIGFSSNSLNNTCTFALYLNGADSALTFTVPTSTTGYFEDASNSVDVVATDAVSIHYTENATSGVTVVRPLKSLWTLPSTGQPLAKRILTIPFLGGSLRTNNF